MMVNLVVGKKKVNCPICKREEEALVSYKYKLMCIGCYTREIIDMTRKENERGN